ncbi:hypothetical protein LTR66_016696, partial [Elasticomyces elasticus]
MRLSSLVFFALPLLAAAEEPQVPLSGKAAAWLDKAKSYIPTGSPVNAAVSVVADKRVQKINQRNYDRVLRSPRLEGEEEWLIYLTGGNKSCFGRCEPVDQVWNEFVALLSALPRSTNKPTLHLGAIDCEKESVLCVGWAANCPSVYHFTYPASTEPAKDITLRVKELNVTTTTTA